MATKRTNDLIDEFFYELDDSVRLGTARRMCKGNYDFMESYKKDKEDVVALMAIKMARYFGGAENDYIKLLGNSIFNDELKDE